ncbi:MAG: preprotein translocase subunit SecE [Frankiaceae bacterium]|nr:preprotein translocase subunit SecE [Frankiaceae bacterium]MDX6275591.1 preprotein translocase subunit SecE [Frankiales bacterium]
MSESGTAVAQRPEPQPASGGRGGKRPGPFRRLGRWVTSRPGATALYWRQVVNELRKVIWPTRKELITYTTVVVVFVSVMTTIVSLLDIGFAKAVLQVFG